VDKIRVYIYGLMTDQRRGIIAFLAKIVLRICSYAYWLLLKFSYIVMRLSGIKRLDCPVVSVGNITMGGTGKTPFVEMLAAHLTRKGKKVGILIRGYGADEVKLLKEKLPNVSISVGRDRVKKGRELQARNKVDVVLMDDGFQHRRLKRDIDIVLIDGTNPFGNGVLLPRGILREPVNSLDRAGIIVVNKSDMSPDGLKRVDDMMHDLNISAPMVESRYILEGIYRIDENIKANEAVNIDRFANRGVGIMSSIANPGYFKWMMKENGAKIVDEISYPDHHDYTAAEIMSSMSRLRSSGAEAILVTEKDAVKIRPIAGELMKGSQVEMLPFWAVSIKVEILKGKEEFFGRLHRLLHI